MDSKITLSFDEAVIEKAKRYADKNNISVSRLVEFLLSKVTAGNHASFADFPIADWVNMVAEGAAEYKPKQRSRASLKKEFYTSRK